MEFCLKKKKKKDKASKSLIEYWWGLGGRKQGQGRGSVAYTQLENYSVSNAKILFLSHNLQKILKYDMNCFLWVRVCSLTVLEGLPVSILSEGNIASAREAALSGSLLRAHL